MDSAGDQREEPLHFDSLDDLVAFCMGHELHVAGDEVQLCEVINCVEDQAAALPQKKRMLPHSWPSTSKGVALELTHWLEWNLFSSPPLTGSPKSSKKAKDDSDQLTDLFATLFGAHCSVCGPLSQRWPALRQPPSLPSLGGLTGSQQCQH